MINGKESYLGKDIKQYFIENNIKSAMVLYLNDNKRYFVNKNKTKGSIFFVKDNK